MLAVEEEEGMFVLEEAAGDEAMSTPPWKTAITHMIPSTYRPIKQTAPDEQLDMQYIYGYRCYDTHNNLKFSPQDQCVYHTAGVGIILDGKDNKQLFNVEHNDDITCLDVHGRMAATGEMGDKPLLCVWDCVTGEIRHRFQGQLRKSIANVAFSRSGNLLAANSNDDNHTLAVYDLSKAA